MIILITSCVPVGVVTYVLGCHCSEWVHTDTKSRRKDPIHRPYLRAKYEVDCWKTLAARRCWNSGTFLAATARNRSTMTQKAEGKIPCTNPTSVPNMKKIGQKVCLSAAGAVHTQVPDWLSLLTLWCDLHHKQKKRCQCPKVPSCQIERKWDERCGRV